MDMNGLHNLPICWSPSSWQLLKWRSGNKNITLPSFVLINCPWPVCSPLICLIALPNLMETLHMRAGHPTVIRAIPCIDGHRDMYEFGGKYKHPLSNQLFFIVLKLYLWAYRPVRLRQFTTIILVIMSVTVVLYYARIYKMQNNQMGL